MLVRFKVIGSLTLLNLFVAVVGRAHADVPATLDPRTYTQTLTLEFASPADAEKATVKAVPVLDGKRWAFSARWDDNRALNTRMQQLATKYGMPGTYYLNRSGDDNRGKFGAAYARQLAADGSSLGVHTLSHDYMPSLMPNTILYEMLHNRIERESEVDQSINSYAAPFTVNQNKDIPNALQYVTQALLRAGLHNQPLWTSDFSFKNPHLAPGEITYAFETRPGDKEPDAEKYDKRIANLKKGYAENTKLSHCMYVGIHVAYPDDKAWGEIEAILAKYAHRPDWWYCNMTQYAAYARQVNKTMITPGAVNGATRTYTLVRPNVVDLGDALPLTLEVEGGQLKSASVDGGATATRVDDTSRTLINLSHAAAEKLPAKIDQIHNKTNAAEPAADAKLADFPSLRMWLSIDDVKNEALLTIANDDTRSLGNVRPILRLPQLFKTGVIEVPSQAVESGARKTLRIPLGERDTTNPDLQGGVMYYAAQVDFALGDEPGRVWATAIAPLSTPLPSNVRDATHMVGPLKPEVLSDPKWQSSSAPGAALADFGTKPNEMWFTTSSVDRMRDSARVVTMFQRGPTWKAASNRVTGPQVFAAAIDFECSEATSITLKFKTDGVLANAYLNGAAVDASKPMAGVVAGANRLVLLLSYKEPRSTFTATSMPASLEPANGKITYVTLSPATNAENEK